MSYLLYTLSSSSFTPNFEMASDAIFLIDHLILFGLTIIEL